MNIYDLSKQIQTKADFEQFLSLLIEDFRINRSSWDNDTIETFLDTVLGFTRDIDGYYKNLNQKVETATPTWRMLADILLAGKVYE